MALTMVHHRDVLPYLLAIKTFAHHADPERIVLVADPSLDESDRAILRRHVPAIEILEAADHRRAELPVGGTWERLSAIARVSQEGPVVQLDADTVTFEHPHDVVQAIAENRSFVIRSEAGVEIQPLDAAAAVGQRLLQQSNHIQACSEARLTELPDWQQYRYVRGCSGFTGFGRGALDAERLAEVSRHMRTIHGARWDDWGTEQVTSNLMAASAPGAILLPHPLYCNADSMAASTVLAHYIGYARHVSRDYERRAVQAVHMLKRGY
ncbi:MAG: hypothetical protein H7337_08830 [Rhizobacter sp.]|nr:hypothetical protein [Rhizobacter sp.]